MKKNFCACKSCCCLGLWALFVVVNVVGKILFLSEDYGSIYYREMSISYALVLNLCENLLFGGNFFLEQ